MSVYDLIADGMGMPKQWVHETIRRAPHSYKSYTIPKKSGGQRWISQPTRKVKAIQLFAVNELLSDMPVSEAATAYRIGISIRENASAHKNNAYIAKFDFTNFFPSISGEDIDQHIARFSGRDFSKEDRNALQRILCRMDLSENLKPHLTIGAPSSPFLSNTIMYEFDETLLKYCNSNNIVYTRYADDLTFSSNEKKCIAKIDRKLKECLEELPYPKLQINESKTFWGSKGNQRRITGLIVTNDNDIGVGREKRRKIRSAMHKFSHNKLSEEEISSLAGYISFLAHIEPLFVAKLESKYGRDVMQRLRSHSFQ